MHDPRSEPSTPAQADPVAAPAPTPPSRPAARKALGLALAIGAAVVASLVAWQGGEEALRSYFFGPTPEAAGQPYDFRELNRQLGAAAPKNAAIAYGILGLALGLGLGLAGGLSRPSLPGALAGGAVGGLAGAAAAAAAAFAFVPIFVRLFDKQAGDLVPLILGRGGVAAGVGLGAGLGFAVGRGGRGAVSAVVGAIIGAVVGAAAFEVASSFLFPLARNDQFLPDLDTDSSFRLVSKLFVALGAALGAVLPSAAGPARVAPAASVPTAEPA